MKSPIDMYIFLPIIIKTGLGIFLPISGLKTLLIDVGAGVGGLAVANFIHHLNNDCEKKLISTPGRLLKSSTDAFVQHFGGMLFTLLVVILPFFKMPVMFFANIPGAKLVLEAIIWGIGVILTTIILNLVDSASKSKKELCAGTISITRIMISLIVLGLAIVYQFFTL
jgi:hypothetical protein